jgi:hypothetical protein
MKLINDLIFIFFCFLWLKVDKYLIHQPRTCVSYCFLYHMITCYQMVIGVAQVVNFYSHLHRLYLNMDVKVLTSLYQGLTLMEISIMIPLLDKNLRFNDKIHVLHFNVLVLVFFFPIVFTSFVSSVTYVLILMLHNRYSISICLRLNSVYMLLFCYFMS